MRLGTQTPWSHDPWTALERLTRAFDAGRPAVPWSVAGTASKVYPPVNLYETEEDWVLTAELPGVASEDLEVTVEGSTVTLRGERRLESTEDANVHRRERQAGVFRRSIELPTELDADKAEASCRNGVLSLRIPKPSACRPRQITVQSR